MGLGKMLGEACSLHAGRPALIHNDRAITYEELQDFTDSLANYLKNLGIVRGDKVAIMLPNVPEFIISYIAVQKLGAVAVTLNVMSTAYELRYLLSNSDSRVLITSSQLASRFEDIKNELPLCKTALITNGLEEKSPFAEALNGPFDLKVEEMADNDPAVMIYTSGLTGQPLGAVLTQRNLLSQADLLRNSCGGTPDDRNLSVIPLFHSFGAVANMLAVLSIGGSTILMDQYHVDSIFRAIQNEKVTYIAAVPRLYLGMLFHDKAGDYKVDSLRMCITGGSTMPPKLIPEFQKKFGVKLVEGYGLTEASPVCSITRIYMPQKFGSIGTPVPDLEAKILDDNHRELPRNTAGELAVKGANIMSGYYQAPEATAQVLHDGWLLTGDLARIDEDGYIFLTGRKKRMIITSGFNVYPREVEMVINMHPAVQESMVVGQSDLMRGEIVKAYVVKKNGDMSDERTILRHCRTYLSSYKLPREVEFVESLEAPSK